MTIKGHEGLLRGKGSVLDSDCYIYMKTAGRNINNLRYADDTTLMTESEKEEVKLSPFADDIVLYT